MSDLQIHSKLFRNSSGYLLGFMALGALEGAFPQPVVGAPVSSTSLHPGLLSFGSPQAEVPLSGAGGVLLLQTVKKGNVSLTIIFKWNARTSSAGEGGRNRHADMPLGEIQVGSTFKEGIWHFHFEPSNSTID